MKKTCFKCKNLKDLSHFSKRRDRPDGLTDMCKGCKAEYDKEYRTKNADSIKKKQKIKTDKNKARKKEYDREHRARKNELRRLRRENDIAFRIEGNLRARINKAVVRGDKSEKTIELLGCTIEDFLTHLEKQFKKGMSWNNYGYETWHIDHIIPCASFDLSVPEQQKECFNFRNMQPLWAEENNFKRAKII